MTENLPHVYVIEGRGSRDYSDCKTVLEALPARMTELPSIDNPEELIAAAKDADALIVSKAPITREVMSALENLKVVVRTGVGYDVIDVPAATELGVIAVNIPDLWIREVANHAIALMLALNRKVLELDKQIRAGVWTAGVPGPFTGAIYDETVGIVGLGNIGTAFAKRMAAFEVKLIGYDPYVDDAHFVELGVERVSLEELSARSDYISVHTLLNDETRHLISDNVFAHTKPNAVLINTARGPVVDENALHRALVDKRLAGAALDVWEKEPANPDHPLLALDNFIATSHAAYFSTPAVARVPARCGEEVTRALRGEQPVNVVNREIFAPGAKRRAM